MKSDPAQAGKAADEPKGNRASRAISAAVPPFRRSSSCVITRATPVCQRREAGVLTAGSIHDRLSPQFQAENVQGARAREVSHFGNLTDAKTKWLLN
jgi:hypothetical protein